MSFTNEDRIRLNKERLLLRNLTVEEADLFMVLLAKVEPTPSDYSDFDFTMRDLIPFEGGMGFTEALTGMKISINIK